MAKNKKRILAIDPGTRHMGYAFLDKGRLLYYGVKIIEKGRSPSETLREGRKIVLRLINDLKPNILAVEKAFISNNKSASLLNVFFDEIKAVGKRKGLKVVCFAPSTVKKHIAKNGWAKKKEVAKALCSKYPELKVYLTQDR
ncbi:crossover junction endodeoxyribonuclease RuvC, partial [Candidatus Aerophobetes bacterium]|nr:crossover junction endodeoxyribonuclease RuvC [Candidatus Aerophobetes bacterium]